LLNPSILLSHSAFLIDGEKTSGSWCFIRLVKAFGRNLYDEPYIIVMLLLETRPFRNNLPFPLKRQVFSYRPYTVTASLDELRTQTTKTKDFIQYRTTPLIYTTYFIHPRQEIQNFMFEIAVLLDSG
jgi:hypothetical protein